MGVLVLFNGSINQAPELPEAGYTYIGVSTGGTFQKMDSNGTITDIESKSAFTFNDMTDVDISGQASGGTLVYSAGTWVVTDLADYVISTVETGVTLSSIADVNVVGVTQGQYLSYSAGTWVAVSDSTDLSNYYNKQQVYNTGETYTNTEVDNLLSGITVDLSGYYTTAQTYNTGETYTRNQITNYVNQYWTSGTGTNSVRTINSYSTGDYAVSEGSGSTASGFASHAENSGTSIGDYSHAEGYSRAIGDYSHAEGWNTITNGGYSHSEGASTTTNGAYAHAEGAGSNAAGYASHSEGDRTETYGAGAHSEGRFTYAYADYSHAEGYNTIASGLSSHVTGQYNFVNINGISSAIIGGSGNTMNHGNSAIIGGLNLTSVSSNTLHCQNLVVFGQHNIGSTGGVSIIDKTYTELKSMYDSSGLTAGQLYKITDYQTVHNILDGTTIVTGETWSGNTETLIVLATSVSTLDKQAYSELYPNDIIHYDITGGDTRDIAFFNGGSSITGLKGIITYREDTIQNNKLYYDFRNVKFRRWMVDAIDWVSGTSYSTKDVIKYSNILYKCKLNHSGTTTPDLDAYNWQQWLDQVYYWSWTSDASAFNTGSITTTNLSMSGYTDLYTFQYYYKVVNDICIEHKILDISPITRLNNIVFNNSNSYKKLHSIKIGYASFNNTIGNDYNYNVIGNSYTYNIIGNSYTYNVIGNYYQYNTIGNIYTYNTIGDNYYNNVIGESNYSNTIGNNYYNNTIGNSYFSNTIGNNYYNNTISNDYNYNTIGNYCRYNIIDVRFTNNNVENTINKTTNSSKVIFGSGVTMNTFKDGCFGDISSDLILTGSTYLNQAYNKEVFMNSASVTRLKFDDGNDNTVYVAITD